MPAAYHRAGPKTDFLDEGMPFLPKATGQEPFVASARLFCPAKLFFLLLPVLQLRQLLGQILPHLGFGPGVGGHVRCAVVDQGAQVGIGKFPVGIAPLAVVLIEAAVRLSAEDAVLQGHAAALAKQLPGAAQQRIDGHAEKRRQLLEGFRIGHRLPRFP